MQPFKKGKLFQASLFTTFSVAILISSIYIDKVQTQEYTIKRIKGNLVNRFLQTTPTCTITQYLVQGTCRTCPVNCQTCTSPYGSCERCPEVAAGKAIIYATQQQGSNAAVCQTHNLDCPNVDPLCLGSCVSSTGEQKCNACLKGSMPLPLGFQYYPPTQPPTGTPTQQPSLKRNLQAATTTPPPPTTKPPTTPPPPSTQYGQTTPPPPTTINGQTTPPPPTTQVGQTTKPPTTPPPMTSQNMQTTPPPMTTIKSSLPPTTGMSSPPPTTGQFGMSTPPITTLPQNQSPSPMPTPTGLMTSNIFRCQPCPIEGCVNCAMNPTTNRPICLECERKLVLLTDTQGYQRCVRDTTLKCPENCVCGDTANPSLCTSCTTTDRILRKEPGISKFTQCQLATAVDPNIPCGPNCTFCNSLNGACMGCAPGFNLTYNQTTFKFECEFTCGEGCLNCNFTSRSCDQCDTQKSFLSYKQGEVKKCINKNRLCHPECKTCDTTGLAKDPPVLQGVCNMCNTGFFVNAQKSCNKCDEFCGACADSTGNCTQCTDSTMSMFKVSTTDLMKCSDRKCTPQCTSCDIVGGLQTYGQPVCKKCSDGNYLSSQIQDCIPCPLNCALCEGSYGTCTSCKTGFSLLASENKCVISGSASSTTCNVPFCDTCESNNLQSCAICTSGFIKNNNNGCSCSITLSYNKQRYSNDWSQIVVQWNGQLRPTATLVKADPQGLCTSLLSSSSATDFKHATSPHECFMKYDDITKATTFMMVLNKTFNPNIMKISFNIANLESPQCTTAFDSAVFTTITLTGGETLVPQIVIDMPSNQIPLGTKSFKISALRTLGLYGKTATYTWTVRSLTPTEAAKLTDLNALLQNLPEISFSESDILKFQGKTIILDLKVTNIFNSQNTTSITIQFLNFEGLIWRDVVENYVVNPKQDFNLMPKIAITATTQSLEIINKFSRLMIECSLFMRNSTTLRFIEISQLTSCTISAGLMRYGNEYMITLLGYDPIKEYTQNITKNVTIQLVKPPLSAQIIGGDQSIDPSKDLTIQIRGTELTKDLTYQWQCFDPSLGVNCLSVNSEKIFLQGTESVMIKANQLTPSKTFKIIFTASDPNDPQRQVTTQVLLTTISATQKPLNVKIWSEAEKSGNFISLYEKNVFVMVIQDTNNTRITNITRFEKKWSITDSNSANFDNYLTNADTLQILPARLQPNNVYSICIEANDKLTKEYGKSCMKYTSLGNSQAFNFVIQPQTGVAFDTVFTFSCQAVQTLTVKFNYEFGIAALATNKDTKEIEQTFIPFEQASPSQQKQYKLNPLPEGQSKVRLYTKLVSQKGEIFYMFQEITVTKPVLNATNVANQVNQTNFDNMNDVYTQAKKIDQVSSSFDAKSQKIAARALLDGITNFTIASSASGSESSQSSNSSSSTSDSNKLTLAQSLQTVTNLYKSNPDILNTADKEKLKLVIKSMIGIDDSDSSFFASTNEGSDTGSSANSGNNGNQGQAGSIGFGSNSNSSATSDIVKQVKKYDSSTAQAILKVCDDLITAENKGSTNSSDNSLKQQAYLGIKKVMSGSLSGVDTSFSYESDNMNAKAMKFQAGNSSGSQSIVIKDPSSNTSETLKVEMPSSDVCGGQSCQMNMISVKDPPVNANSENQGDIIASTISISFEKSSQSSSDSSSISVEKVKVNNLTEPIKISIKYNTTKVKDGYKQRCVYFDEKTNQMSDSGVISVVDNITGKVQCQVYHLTDFSIESFDPTYAQRNRMNSNLQKYESFQAIPMQETFAVAATLFIGLLTIALIIFGIVFDQRDQQKYEEMKSNKMSVIRLLDILYFNRSEDAHLHMMRQDNKLEQSRRELKSKNTDLNDSNSLDYSVDMDSSRNGIMDSATKIQLKKQITTASIIKLAIKNQHRLMQIFIFYDNQIPRAVKAVEFGTSLFILMLFAGLYSASDSMNVMQSIIPSFIGIAIQKIILLFANLMVRRSQAIIASKKSPEQRNKELENQDTDTDRPNSYQNAVSQTNNHITPQKRSSTEMISLIFGLVFMTIIIATCLFGSFMMAETLDESDNMQWTINFVIAMIIDLVIVEMILVTLGAVITMKIGSSPDALGGVRNIMLNLGPKAIRRAILSENQGSGQSKHNSPNYHTNQQQQQVDIQQQQQWAVQQQQQRMLQEQQLIRQMQQQRMQQQQQQQVQQQVKQ
eukprot:403331462